MAEYATHTSYTQWAATNTTVTPTNLHRLLRYANALVTAYIEGLAWDPEDPAHIDALHEAACIQVETWATNQLDPSTVAYSESGVRSSASITGGSIGYAGASQAARNRADSGKLLCFESRLILSNAGIRPAQAVVVG